MLFIVERKQTSAFFFDAIKIMVLSNSSSPHSSSSSPPSTSSLNLTNISNYQHDPLMSDVVSSSEEAGKCINNQNGQLDNKDESPSVSKANIHQSSTSIDSFIQPNQLSKPNSIRQYSRNHQRRFHRRFPSIDPEEKLIDCKSGNSVYIIRTINLFN